MDNELLFQEIEDFLREPHKTIPVHLIASGDRYSVFRSGSVIIVEDKHLDVTVFMPIIGDLGEKQ